MTETRSYNFEIRTEETENTGEIVGRPIVYNSETDMGYFIERIKVGALNKTDLKDVRFLVNHDTNKIPLARSRNNNKNSTMQLMVDENGLSIRVRLDLENTESKNLYSAIKRGDITGMSFMFTVKGEEWTNLESDMPTRTITDIERVFEVSAVTFPAYESTEINTRNKLALDNARRTLDSERRLLENRQKEVTFLKEKLRVIKEY